ncbi:MAG TPA: hypothetical protein DD435_06870 [Cyanobacteria bacterium UBA8530]|nr:hypothetical protein [Cyanobacteria bacterium UBA8530]
MKEKKAKIVALGVLPLMFCLVACESQSRLQVNTPVESLTENTRMNVLQVASSSGTAVVIPIPADNQVAAPFVNKAPAPLYSANRISLVASGRSMDFYRTTAVLPISPVATASIPVLSTFVAAPLPTDNAGNANLLLSLDGKQAVTYRANIVSR